MGFERVSDFVVQPVHDPGVLEQIVGESREESGRRLAPRTEQNSLRAIDFTTRHAFFVVVAEDVRQEIWSVPGTQLQSPSHLLAGVVKVLAADSFHGRWDEQFDDSLERWEPPCRRHLDACLDAAEGRGHPGVVLRVAEAPERLAEGQVGDDVEGGVVEPFHNVDGAWLLTQPAYERVHVRLDERFLLVEGFVGEGVGEQAPDT